MIRAARSQLVAWACRPRLRLLYVIDPTVLYTYICGTYFDADCAELALLAVCFLGAQFVDPAGDRERERERVGELL